ncbi:hypothetical protein EVAR_87651_1 [Eumeta japonica]|uniref:Uncharacterized protein n=1 Tax=Eumeta variegata TaxID=151549 RepID=A0A4C1WLS5_EUMVA|nr:hypothetical protein EVAR_87651_1 [Eumeta japonica]
MNSLSVLDEIGHEKEHHCSKTILFLKIPEKLQIARLELDSEGYASFQVIVRFWATDYSSDVDGAHRAPSIYCRQQHRVRLRYKPTEPPTQSPRTACGYVDRLFFTSHVLRGAADKFAA